MAKLCGEGRRSPALRPGRSLFQTPRPVIALGGLVIGIAVSALAVDTQPLIIGISPRAFRNAGLSDLERNALPGVSQKIVDYHQFSNQLNAKAAALAAEQANTEKANYLETIRNWKAQVNYDSLDPWQRANNDAFIQSEAAKWDEGGAFRAELQKRNRDGFSDDTKKRWDGVVQSVANQIRLKQTIETGVSSLLGRLLPGRRTPPTPVPSVDEKALRERLDKLWMAKTMLEHTLSDRYDRPVQVRIESAEDLVNGASTPDHPVDAALLAPEEAAKLQADTKLNPCGIVTSEYSEVRDGLRNQLLIPVDHPALKKLTGMDRYLTAKNAAWGNGWEYNTPHPDLPELDALREAGWRPRLREAYPETNFNYLNYEFDPADQMTNQWIDATSDLKEAIRNAEATSAPVPQEWRTRLRTLNTYYQFHLGEIYRNYENQAEAITGNMADAVNRNSPISPGNPDIASVMPVILTPFAGLKLTASGLTKLLQTLSETHSPEYITGTEGLDLFSTMLREHHIPPFPQSQNYPNFEDLARDLLLNQIHSENGSVKKEKRGFAVLTKAAVDSLTGLNPSWVNHFVVIDLPDRSPQNGLWCARSLNPQTHDALNPKWITSYEDEVAPGEFLVMGPLGMLEWAPTPAGYADQIRRYRERQNPTPDVPHAQGVSSPPMGTHN